MTTRLIQETREFIGEQLAQMKAPCVASSFGKDSMVVLWLVREQKKDVDVVYFDAFPSPTKHKFAEEIAARWELTLHTPTAFGRDVIGKGGHVEILEAHLFAPTRAMIFPMEAEPGYVPDENCLCAVEKLNAPTAECQFAFDGVFIGHRNDDIDPTHGAVPLAEKAVIYDDFRYLYPLKDWTERDIWEVSQLLSIPQNEARYRANDMATNNDYYPLCTACLSSDVPVLCPKKQTVIPGVRQAMRLDEKREAWRATFVNLAA